MTQPQLTETDRAIMSVMQVARDLAEGTITVADLDAAASADVRAAFATVIGPTDPAWPVQVDVCRQVLALNGVPADELAEWTAVVRASEGVAPLAGGSWIEQALEGMAADDEDDDSVD